MFWPSHYIIMGKFCWLRLYIRIRYLKWVRQYTSKNFFLRFFSLFSKPNVFKIIVIKQVLNLHYLGVPCTSDDNQLDLLRQFPSLHCGPSRLLWGCNSLKWRKFTFKELKTFYCVSEENVPLLCFMLWIHNSWILKKKNI